MNREILFRGFHPCEGGSTTIYVEGEAIRGEWIEGSLLIYPDGDCFICCDDADPCILNKVDVLPSTICQYTGLTDKNGRKIFEGDKAICPYLDPIFRTPWDNNGVKCLNNVPLPVIYQSGTFCIDYCREELGIVALNAFCVDKDIEVTGTVWDKECENGLD